MSPKARWRVLIGAGDRRLHHCCYPAPGRADSAIAEADGNGVGLSTVGTSGPTEAGKIISAATVEVNNSSRYKRRKSMGLTTAIVGPIIGRGEDCFQRNESGLMQPTKPGTQWWRCLWECLGTMAYTSLVTGLKRDRLRFAGA
jgi:hypothetical protein